MANRSGKDHIFKWNEQRTNAALALAEGKTRKEAADLAGVDERTIYTWLAHPEFGAEVDRLSLMIGIASRAERVRIAHRVIRQMVPDTGNIPTSKDVLDWLKYAQSETDGIKLDLAKLAAAIGENDSPLATGGSAGVGASQEQSIGQ